ncbi:hypothetical protein FQR65_LT09170 [Abscondita terminalis]|nr:hypothetical protein FQR65_LT09170 [Abscondita terminalis]
MLVNLHVLQLHTQYPYCNNKHTDTDTIRLLQALAILLMATGIKCNAIPHQDIDVIDMCILGCDRCFKGDTLVNCANHCISSKASVAQIWKLVCKALEQDYMFFEMFNQ